MSEPEHEDIEIRTPADLRQIIAAIHQSAGDSADTAAALSERALSEVLRGVLTGEGPTAHGRPHFSRTLDAEDAALCARILTAAAGPESAPVSRKEAEILFKIHEAALDREDGGRFDDLFAKAIAHHVLAMVGRPVPPREVALSPATPLADWVAPAPVGVTDREIGQWLTSRLRGQRRVGAAINALLGLLIGTGATTWAVSLAAVLDFAA